MKMKYAVLNELPINAVLHELRRAKLPAKTALNLLKIHRVIEMEFNNMREIFLAQVKLHAELDEKGQGVVVEGKWKWKSPEDQAAVDKFMEEYSQQEFEIPFPKVHVAEFPHVQLSMEELNALAPILQDLTVAENSTV